MTTILSYGMGVDSTALLLHWLENPEARDYIVKTVVSGEQLEPHFRRIGRGRVDLNDLIVITAMTGDEFPDLKELVETHVLPRLRQHGIRYVQVARKSLKEPLEILDDTPMPYTLHLDGAFKLSDYLLLNGTIPEYRPNRRRCSIKSKGWPLDAWIAEAMGEEPFVQAIGFNAKEAKRIMKDKSYSAVRWEGQKTEIYPLMWDWGWDYQACQDYIHSVTGASWPKSACTFCPFTMGKDPVLTRFGAFPDHGAFALFVEFNSVALNHRMTLYPKERTLMSVVQAQGDYETLTRFDEFLNRWEWAIYHVRRIYRKRGNAARSIRAIEVGTREEIQQNLLPQHGELSFEGGIPRVFVQKVHDRYPALQEMFVALPHVPQDKEVAKFEGWWERAMKRDWTFLKKEYQPLEVEEEVEHPEEEEEDALDLSGARKGRRLRVVTPPEITLDVFEQDDRKKTIEWECDLSDTLRIPFPPNCPV